MSVQDGSTDIAMAMDIPEDGGQAREASLENENVIMNLNDPAAADQIESMTITYTEPTDHGQITGPRVIENSDFTEALAGEQLIQMANAFALEQEKQGLETDAGVPTVLEITSLKAAGQNDQQVGQSEIGTMAQTEAIQNITPQDPSIITSSGAQQVVELVPVQSDKGDGRIYYQIANSSNEGTVTSQGTISTDAAIQEISFDQAHATEVIGQEVSNIENQEIVIDGLHLPLPYQNYENIRTEVLEDGSLQLYVVDDGSTGTKSNDPQPVQADTLYVTEPPIQKSEAGMQTSLMSIQAKKYRDVATQITVFPKFSRQGLFDVSTQVSARDIHVAPRTKNLPNGTTVIQNSIKTQNESTVVLNPGNENELIFHKCNICGKVYKNKMNWQNHIKLHAQEKVYMCGYCGKIYQRGSLSSHLRTHSELRQIAVFENLPNELKRKNYKHAPGKIFPSEEASIIELNIADVAMEIDPELFPPPTFEKTASKSLPSPPPLPPVIETTEDAEVYTDSDIPAKMHMEVEAEAEIQEGTKTKFIYKCNVCGKEYNNKSNCHRHLKSHTDSKSFKCGYCGKAFAHRYEVRMHCRTHTGEKPFKCPICTRGFNESGNLRRHMKIHVGDDSPYKCGVCFKGFDNTLRLNAHMKVHTGDIVCDVCNKKFGKISDLYRHIKIHSGERPYKCEICQKTFCQKVNLVTHQRTHTGHKAYRCDICGLGFTRKSILQTHKKSHEEGEEYAVERTASRPIKEEVEVLEADVIEHMEALSQEFVDSPGSSRKGEKIVLPDGQEVIVEDADDDSGSEDKNIEIIVKN